MKIGVLTFHYMVNQGSVLQAYCVSSLLKKKYPGANVEIIDLIPKNRGDNEKKFYRKAPPFIRFDSLAKYLSINRFWKNRVSFSPRCESMELESQIQFINDQQYDAIFTGSDTVWMHSDKLNNVLPHIYFLPKGIVAKKYSIAASSDPLNDENAYLERATVLNETLNEYEAILVRDKLTFDLIEKLGIENAKQIADPTILFPFEKSLNIKVDKTKPIKKRRIFIHQGNKEIKKLINDLLSETGEFEFPDFEEKSSLFSGDHMIDYLNEYADIDILITDRFHRSIFAMKLSNALVINVENYLKNPVPNSKGRDLFTKIGMPEYCIRYEKDGDRELKENLLSLIQNWNEKEFQKREKGLQEFIKKNLDIWEAIK